MEFEVGDVIINKGKKEMYGIIQGVAIIGDKDIGNWFIESNGARWVLLYGWQKNFKKVNAKQAEELREKILNTYDRSIDLGKKTPK